MESIASQRTAEVLGMLQTMLDRRLGRACRIRAVDHRASAFRSSFAIEEIDVVLERGELLRLILKAVGTQGLLANASMAKPLFLHDPLREIEFYRHVLADRPDLGTAALYSTVVEPARDRYWLLIERAPGTELYRIDELEAWRAAAEWLARLHLELAPLATDPTSPGVTRLLRYDAEFVRMWMVRAVAIVRVQDPSLPAELRMGLERLASRYDRVVERLASMPQTIIHGEFYPSNILVQRDSPILRVCPVDWEMVAVGPRLMDLAALLAGERSEYRRRELALAYRSALPGHDHDSDQRTFFEDLAYCRLHLAVQWLGWSPDESPRTYRAHDWISDALRLAEGLGI